ncbi:ER membrane protein complex subunit 4, partial [Intoshia linei]
IKKATSNSYIDFRSKKKVEYANPPGYQSNFDTQKLIGKVDQSLVATKSWDIALAPLKQIPMNMLMMYMSGNSIGIFPLMMIVMMTIRPIKTLLQYKKTFDQIQGSYMFLQKLVFLLGNLVGIVLAAYKCHIIGILPTHQSDWISFHQTH